MSVCDKLLTASDALAAAVLAYEDERRKLGLSFRTARLRERMVEAARAAVEVNAGARTVLRAAARALAATPDAAPVPANDFEPEPHRA